MAAIHSTRMQMSVASGRVALKGCAPRPCLSTRTAAIVRASGQAAENSVSVVGTAVAVSTAVSTLMYSGNALAATEIAQLAGGDNRVGILASLLVPVLGWVAFNALGPLTNQINKMSGKSIAAATGLGAAATLMFAQNADAASEVAQLAANDNRVAILGSLLLPVLGWVAFNALGPLINQIDKMSGKSVAAATGLGAAATLMFAQNADAASEVAQLAAGDNRVGILASLLVPVLGWVAFNALGPLQNQMDKMSGKSVAAATGLGAAATLMFAQNADAATEVAQLAAGDNRVGILASLLVPVLGWVAFNALGPLQNQMNKMSGK